MGDFDNAEIYLKIFSSFFSELQSLENQEKIFLRLNEKKN
jgi:hypothetical protein